MQEKMALMKHARTSWASPCDGSQLMCIVAVLFGSVGLR